MNWIVTESMSMGLDGLLAEELDATKTTPPAWANLSLHRNGTRLIPASRFCDVMSVSASTVSYSVGMILILNIAVVGNALVLVAMLMSPSLRNRVTTFFILSLACSDIAFAVCLIPFKVSMSLHNDLFCLPLSACYWYLMSDAFVNVTSILNLFLIAMDRFIAIKLPFRYREVLSPFRAKVLIACVWLFGMVWAVIGVVQWERSDGMNSIASISLTSTDQFGNPGPPRCMNSNKLYYVVSACGLYLVPLAIMTLAYVRILMVALSQIRTIEATQLPVGHFILDSSSNHVSKMNGALGNVDRKKRNRNRKRKKELRATKSVAIVYCTFVCCFVPSMIITFIIFGDPDFFANVYSRDPSLFLFIFYTFIEVLPVLNTGLNPFIYSFSNKQFRLAFKRALYKLGGRHLPPDTIIDSAYRLDGSPSHARSLRASVDCSCNARVSKVSATSFLIPPSGLAMNVSSSNDESLLKIPTISSSESTPSLQSPQRQLSSLCHSLSRSLEPQAVESGGYSATTDQRSSAAKQESNGLKHSPMSDLEHASFV